MSVEIHTCPKSIFDLTNFDSRLTKLIQKPSPVLGKSESSAIAGMLSCFSSIESPLRLSQLLSDNIMRLDNIALKTLNLIPNKNDKGFNR